ncbi:hypothetical protein K2173_010885 [Erythroxylum novogranatense]|uniref:NPF family transporter n=1 Tax=Erythroxylum novogranatense TaxID=1862640 RepID=A0AAV8T175_9ROSI|nr:hypothetical protein K2173_010885 [Erythroxylum novogranatense]
MEPNIELQNGTRPRKDKLEYEEEEKKKKKIGNGKNNKKVGGMKAVPFILATEVCDRFSTVGFHANLISYLTQKLELPLVKASNIVSNFDGTAGLTTVIGALIADSFAGRYWTIFVSCLFYELGLVCLTITAVLKSLHPPPCPNVVNCKEASGFQLGILYLCLLLISIGLGGIRPCVLSFAADQIGMDKASVESRGWNFFTWYYFSLGVARLTAVTVVVYIQDNVGWTWGLAIPAIAMAVSFLVFTCGSSLYKKVKPEGSPIVRLAQVIVAALRKRKGLIPRDAGQLYQNQELDAPISVHGKLLHTDQFRWLDKAAIVKNGEETNPPNLWKLATVHRIEEIKSFIRILPIWAAGVILVSATSHQSSFQIQQARTLNRHLSHSFQIPPASLSVFSILTLLAGLALYDRAFVPISRRFTGNPMGITCLQRMGIGLFLSIIGTSTAALVETKRKSVATRYNLLDSPKAIIPMSVFWLVPQYCFHGLTEVFKTVGLYEFLYDQSPESMKSIAIGLFWVANSVGNYLGTLIVSLIHKYTGHRNNWLPDRNMNRGKLDYYYWLVTGIQVINLVYYLVCAWFYTNKPLEEVKQIDGEDIVDEAAKNGRVLENGTPGSV